MTSSNPKKVAVIGFDAGLPNRVMKYVGEGVLPNFAKLIKGGVFAENCLVPHPTITPPNWTTLATGSWPGTHGITDFHIHKVGDPLDMNGVHQGFDRNDCKVENIWEAAEKAGKRSIVFNWPASWPSRLKHGIVAGGNGTSLNDWRPNHLKFTQGYVSVGADMVFSTVLLPGGGTKVEFGDADVWQNLPASARQEPQEAEAKLPFPDSPYEMEQVTWYFLAQDSQGNGYDTITVSPTRDFRDAYCILRKGEWSKKIFADFRTRQGEVKEASFHMKLVDLTPDLAGFKLYVTSIGESGGWTNPPEVALEISRYSRMGDFGLRGAGIRAWARGWIDLDTQLEITEMHSVFLGEAAEYLLKKKKWDIFYMHCHIPDWINHAWLTRIDPSVTKDQAVNLQYEEAERRIHIGMDKMLGRIMAAAGRGATFFLVSDHGAVPTGAPVPFIKALEEKGLIKVTSGAMHADKGMGEFAAMYTGLKIDWSQSKAAPQRAVHVYVNLKGRDPQGIVEPEDYEKVRQEIIDAYLAYVDPETGKRPFAMALRREDARPFGCYGEGVGDVIYAIYPWFGGQHGNHLPTAEWGIGTLKGLLVMNGPDFKAGDTLTRTAWITDVVPTICHIMDLPMPDGAEGAILYQALKEPDARLKELNKLRKALGKN